MSSRAHRAPSPPAPRGAPRAPAPPPAAGSPRLAARTHRFLGMEPAAGPAGPPCALQGLGDSAARPEPRRCPEMMRSRRRAEDGDPPPLPAASAAMALPCCAAERCRVRGQAGGRRRAPLPAEPGGRGRPAGSPPGSSRQGSPVPSARSPQRGSPQLVTKRSVVAWAWVGC